MRRKVKAMPLPSKDHIMAADVNRAYMANKEQPSEYAKRMFRQPPYIYFSACPDPEYRTPPTAKRE